jgi:hypothetical protein
VVSCLRSHPYLDPTLKRYSFFINLPCGAIAAASIALFFRVPKAVKPTEATLKERILQMDIPGFLLVLASVVCYLLGMQWGGVVKSWGSAGVIGTIVGSVVLFVTFLAVEWYQGERALLLPSILKNRTIAHGCAFSFLYVVTLLFSHIFLVPSRRTTVVLIFMPF